MADQNFDINEMVRKAMLMKELQDSQQGNIAGSVNYQPPSQQASQYTPQMMTPPSVDVKMPPMDKFEAAATSLENLPQQPDPRAKDPSGKDVYPRSKLLTALSMPFQFANIMSNPKKGMENLDLLTRKGYGTAEQKYEQQESRAQAAFKIQNDVLSARLKILRDDLSAKEGMASTQMAIGKYNQWIQQLPQEAQYEAARLGEMQARAAAAQAPVYSKTTENIRYKDSDGNIKSSEGFIKTFHDGRMPEYVVPGRKDPIKNEDVIGISKPVTASSNPVIQQINDQRQLIRDQFGREPTPAEDDKIIKDVRLLGQTEIAKREAVVLAKKTIGSHINKDYITPVNRTILGLENARTTLQAALGQTDDKKRNAVAAAIAPLEEVRNVVGSGRVAVSEYPIINAAPGKPQSGVAWVKNLLGLGAPVPDATLNDLIRLLDIHMKDAQGLRDIASEWNYKVLDPDTEEEVTTAGKGFDAAVKAYQNPKLTLKQEIDRRGLLPKQ